MKDSIIKGTGNSRYLKSAIPEDITFAQFVAMLREGTLPIDLNGINEDGFSQLGPALGKETLLNDAAEKAVWGNSADRTVSDAIAALSAIPWKLIDKIDNTVGYSGEWTAPDVFGDGSAYDLGAYMIGGGESGGAALEAYKSMDTGKDFELNAYGGSSGNARNHIFANVIPGMLYAWVIGRGGASGTCSTPNSTATSGKNAGGTTSFGGVTAEGGSGSNSSNPCTTTSGNTRAYFGGEMERYNQNRFDPDMIALACGMGAYVYIHRNSDGTFSSYAYKQTPAIENPTIGTLGTADSQVNTSGGSVTAIGVAGTNGNGGGGAAAASANSSSTMGTVTATSGAGGDGVIYLYARRKVASE